MMRTPSLLRLAACLALASCGSDRLAGGNSTEADNALTGIVVDSAGRPVAGARVRAMPERSVDTSDLRTTTTDASGAWTLSVDPGRWMVVVRHRDGAGAALARAGDAPRCVLKPSATLSGTVRCDGACDAVVAVRGSGVRVRVDSLGRWRIDALPAGVPLEAVAIPSAGDTAALPGRILDPGEMATSSPFQLASAWVAESLQVADLLGRIGLPASQVRRRTRFDSTGAPIGLGLDSLGLDSLPSDLPIPDWVHDVDLSRNRLRTPPSVLSSHALLWNLDLSGNPLDGGAWSGFADLSALSLSGCGLKTLPDLRALGRLGFLALDGDSLTSLPAWVWSASSLVSVSVKDNRIDSLPAVAALSSMRELQLGGNRLRRLPDGWRNLSSLRELWLYSNPFDSLPDSLGTVLPALRLLHLEGMGLGRLPSTLAALPAESTVVVVRGNALCGDQGTALEAWLDRIFGSPWRTAQPQDCP